MHAHALHAHAMRQVGFKGLHWAWMAVAAVQYLHDSPTSCHVMESEDPARWLAYYVSFLANFPWDTVALMPTDTKAPRALRSSLQQRREETKNDAAVIILSGPWMELRRCR